MNISVVKSIASKIENIDEVESEINKIISDHKGQKGKIVKTKMEI